LARIAEPAGGTVADDGARAVGEGGAVEPDDLAARVARLETAVAHAAEALADGVAPVPAAATAAARHRGTTPLAKGVRTVVQLGVAAIPGWALGTTTSAVVGWIVTLVLTPLVVVVQNKLEDDVLGRGLLRRVGP
jgi:hypothetical protein